jgi:pimeloyl-ACP methyl ester carboxylesterase
MFVRRSGTPGMRGTVLYLHGLGESGLCFEHIPEHHELADWDHAIVDLPGYGRSLWPELPMDMAAVADHLHNWMKEKLQEPVYLVGHSMGAIIALVVAERHPSHVRGLIDIDGNKCDADCTFSGQAASMCLSDFLSEGFASMLDRVYRAGLGQQAMRGYFASMRLCDPSAFHLHAEELCELSRSNLLADRLASVPVPTAFIAGSPGGASELALEQVEAAKIPTYRVSPSGHWPFLDQPEQFVKTFAKILTQMQS